MFSARDHPRIAQKEVQRELGSTRAKESPKPPADITPETDNICVSGTLFFTVFRDLNHPRANRGPTLTQQLPCQGVGKTVS